MKLPSNRITRSTNKATLLKRFAEIDGMMYYQPLARGGKKNKGR